MQAPASLGHFLDWPHDRLSALVETVALGADGLLSGKRGGRCAHRQLRVARRRRHVSPLG